MTSETYRISQTYRDIEIVYLEDPNRWRFTANGRERTAESLVKAREAIDRALDDVKRGKARAWAPFEAYLEPRFGGDYRKVKVTSQAEDDYAGSQFWISMPDDNGGFKRSKVRGRELVEANSSNESRIAEVASLNEQRQRLDERIGQLKTAMTQVTVPKDAN